MALEIEFAPLSVEELPALAAEKKAEGARFVQLLAVNTEEGIDLVYTFMKGDVLTNHEIKGVGPDMTVPSITDQFLAAFVFENEVHDLFGVSISDIAIDFGGNFYALSQKEPMTIISPEQKAAREKAKKLAGREGGQRTSGGRDRGAGRVPGRAPRRAGGQQAPRADRALGQRRPRRAFGRRRPGEGGAREGRARREGQEGRRGRSRAKEAALEEKLAGMDPEKAAKVRAAMEAKAAREAAAQKEGE